MLSSVTNLQGYNAQPQAGCSDSTYPDGHCARTCDNRTVVSTRISTVLVFDMPSGSGSSTHTHVETGRQTVFRFCG